MTDSDIARTDALVRRLAAGSGGPPRRPRPWWPLLLGAEAGALALAALVVAAGFGLRTDLAGYAVSPVFLFKLAAMASLAIGGIVLVHGAGTPGARRPIAVMLLPAVLVLVAGIALLDDAVPLSGARAVSVPICLAAIVLAALPGLALLLGVLRRAVPTAPTRAGAIAGLLAGATAALAYTLSCRNDGGLFVAVWYPVAILLTCGIGALAGRRLLAW